ncbi:MAG: AAA family ATPase [Acidimicrobiales bacterium]
MVGPAGTGKTTTLLHAAADLSRHGRPVFGVAPTAKAAKVLGDETGMPADTVAKLLHEWRTGAPHDPYRLPAGTTLVVDEASMVGTGALAHLVDLAVSQRWRLVLVGDPRQLQAVGRGGMFAELCRTGRTHELVTIHRFRHRWEQAASLQLRAANADALDAYIRHGRVTAGTVDGLVAEAARRWLAHTAAGHRVAVVAETNNHVDALNGAIQRQRRVHGELGAPAVRVAGDETVAVGDIVATRRNDRTLRTDRGEPVRNRDLWTILDTRRDGSLTVSHRAGHGQVTLSADYTRAHVRLGYAATGHGYEGDTVDVSLGVVTPPPATAASTSPPPAAARAINSSWSPTEPSTPETSSNRSSPTTAPTSPPSPNASTSPPRSPAADAGRPTCAPPRKWSRPPGERSTTHASAPRRTCARLPPPRPTSKRPRPSCEPAEPPGPKHRSGGADGWSDASSRRTRSWTRHAIGETAPQSAQPPTSPTSGLEPPTSRRPSRRPRSCTFATASTASQLRHPRRASSAAPVLARWGCDRQTHNREPVRSGHGCPSSGASVAG